MFKSKFILIIFSGFLCFQAKAQGNLPDIDNKPFHFGFSLGFNAMDFGIVPSLMEIDGEVYTANISDLQPGFTVGIISDMRLSRYLNLRLTPMLNFGDRNIVYKSKPGGLTQNINITSIPVCVPLLLKYSSERYKNFRPYLIGGGGFYVDLGRATDKPLLLKPFDVYSEFGVGCDIYFSFFKLSPEIKFALGMNNMLTPLDERTSGLILTDKDKIYSNALSQLTSRILTFTFNFE